MAVSSDVRPAEEQTSAPGHASGTLGISLLGMILFIASETMFFGGLFGAYFTLRAVTPEWPPPGTPELDVVLSAVLTGILVLSSVTMQFAVWAVRKGNRPALIRWLAVTITLGAVFLIGQGYEYFHLLNEGFRLSSSVYGSLFYTMTGFHGLHVFGGVVFLAVLLLRAAGGQFTPTRHDPIEMGSYYWHFVDVVWIGLWATLYLLT